MKHQNAPNERTMLLDFVQDDFANVSQLRREMMRAFLLTKRINDGDHIIDERHERDILAIVRTLTELLDALSLCGTKTSFNESTAAKIISETLILDLDNKACSIEAHRESLNHFALVVLDSSNFSDNHDLENIIWFFDQVNSLINDLESLLHRSQVVAAAYAFNVNGNQMEMIDPEELNLEELQIANKKNS